MRESAHIVLRFTASVVAKTYVGAQLISRACPLASSAVGIAIIRRVHLPMFRKLRSIWAISGGIHTEDILEKDTGSVLRQTTTRYH